jgi:MFS family permease
MQVKSFWTHPWTLVVAGGLIMGMALGVRHVQGLFLVPVTMDHGWSRETFAFAIAVQNLAWGVAQPFTGMVADRYGSMKVIAAGVLLYATGLVLMAQSHTPVQFTLSAGLCIGVALSGTSFGAIYGALSRIVAPERRSWALAAAGAIGGFGQFAMVPATQGLLDAMGWAAALMAIALVTALLVPLALPLTEPQAASAGAGATMPLSTALRQAFGHGGFWLLNFGFLACGFQLAFIASHMPAYLLDHGFTPQDGVVALALIALTNVLGTYACGPLGAAYRRKRLLAMIYLLRTAAIAAFVMLPLSTTTLYAFSIAMGLLWLGTAPLTNGLVSQIFGVRYVSTLFGFVFLSHQVGSFLGVWLGGIVFEATRSYDAVWFGAMGLGLLAAALHWGIDDRELATPPVAVPA